MRICRRTSPSRRRRTSPVKLVLRGYTGKIGGNLNLEQTVGLGNDSRGNVANGDRRDDGETFAGDGRVGARS